jgi:hypothetical protein
MPSTAWTHPPPRRRTGTVHIAGELPLLFLFRHGRQQEVHDGGLVRLDETFFHLTDSIDGNMLFGGRTNWSKKWLATKILCTLLLDID